LGFFDVDLEDLDVVDAFALVVVDFRLVVAVVAFFLRVGVGAVVPLLLVVASAMEGVALISEPSPDDDDTLLDGLPLVALSNVVPGTIL